MKLTKIHTRQICLKCFVNDSEILFNDLKCCVYDFERLFNDFEMNFNDLSSCPNKL